MPSIMKSLARYCFIPGCTSGYHKERAINKRLGLRNGSMFTARNEAQIKKWRKAIPRKDKLFRKNDVVCELHFNEDDIIRYYETKLPNGVVHRFERGRPVLKQNAVPSIFPSTSENVTEERRNGKPGVKGHPVSKSRRKKRLTKADFNGEVFDKGHEGAWRKTEWLVTEQIKEKQANTNFGLVNCAQAEFNCITDVFDEDIVTVKPCLMNGLSKEICEAFNMTFLVQNLKNIMLPSVNWTVAALGKDLIFLCFGKNFLAEKTLVVMEDLTIKVMIENKEIFIDGMKTVKNTDDLIKIIGYLDVLQVSDIDFEV